MPWFRKILGSCRAPFWGVNGHDLDPMSLDSNVQCDGKGNPLRHFTPYPNPGSSGVNVFDQDL